jgi:signal transduction histidine kinase
MSDFFRSHWEPWRGPARAKDQFLAVLAHELRTPLAAILASLEVLRRCGGGDATAERARGMVERQARHMGRLIDELLDLSRIDRGKVELCKKRLELLSVVVDAIESVRPLIEARRHDLEVVLPPQPLYLDADPLRLEQIIVNLLTNAAKYTEPGGNIWLTVERVHGKAVVRVRDTGIGIARDILPSIFDLFVQAKNGSQGGLGIGLHLVRGLVRLHGGSVTAASAGAGQGSEFIVRLPLQEEPAEQEHQRVPGERTGRLRQRSLPRENDAWPNPATQPTPAPSRAL